MGVSGKNASRFIKKAFTLAEVLITLAIIGVVAAMTIPTLMTKTQNAEHVTALKKFYSTFNQALQSMAADYGCPGDLKCTGIFNSTTNNDSFGDIISKYFKVIKNCGSQENVGCFKPTTPNTYDGANSTYTYTFDRSYYYKFVIEDGASISLYNYATNCNTDWSRGATGHMAQTCGWLAVDINGLKPPNLLGRDIFSFWITNGKGALLYPTGGADDAGWGDTSNWWRDSSGNPKYCDPSNKQNAIFCAGRIMEQGWQMNY